MGGSPQPITAPPQVGQNIKSGLMVYIGTGKYFDVSDSKIDSDASSLDSFYGLQDDGLVIKRSQLVKQEILVEVDVSEGLRSRITSDNKVDYNTHKGWYLDLLTPPAANNDGEHATRSEGKYVSGSETGVGMFRESAS